jgi:hypothetical protein
MLPSEVTATPKGSEPTGIAAVTVSVAVAITDTVLKHQSADLLNAENSL